jgi:serine/threonine protein kinase
LKKDKFQIFSVDRKQETITALQKVYMEIHFMAKLSHPNVVNIYEFIQQDDKDDIY